MSIDIQLRKVSSCYACIEYKEGLESTTLNREEMLLLAKDLQELSLDVLAMAIHMEATE